MEFCALGALWKGQRPPWVRVGGSGGDRTWDGIAHSPASQPISDRVALSPPCPRARPAHVLASLTGCPKARRRPSAAAFKRATPLLAQPFCDWRFDLLAQIAPASRRAQCIAIHTFLRGARLSTAIESEASGRSSLHASCTLRRWAHVVAEAWRLPVGHPFLYCLVWSRFA